ncbi:MAG: ABC transporter ATP-binding protein [Spirochaeta sp.]
MESAIELTNLSAGYDDIPVLQGISVKIARNKITAILGGSGSGKSTLLKTILKLIPSIEGTITVLGKDINQQSEHDFNRLLRNIGVLFQNGALINSLNLYENVALPLLQHTDLPEDIVREMVFRQLGRVGLEQNLWKFPSELSGGMQKRAGLARAMILNPALLCCDEPSAGLDPVTSASLDDLLLELQSEFNITIVVVTHELASIRRIADDLVFLHDGQCVFYGKTAEAIKSGPRIVQDFFSVNKMT